MALGGRALLHPRRQEPAADGDRGPRGPEAASALAPLAARRATTSASGWGRRSRSRSARASSGPGPRSGSMPTELMAVRNAGKDEVDAYERLLTDAMKGDPTLFVREDAVEAAWKVVDGILDNVTPVHPYEPGTWGPDRGEPPDASASRAGTTRRRSREDEAGGDRRGPATGRQRRAARVALEPLGPVPVRAGLGHGARGLQRATAPPGTTFPHDHARSRAYRWNEDGLARDLRPPPARLLRARALEREGPDPEGAALRPDELRGQPRRGRQGVLVLPRLDADALVHEVPLQVPAGGVPVRGSSSRRTAGARSRIPSTSCSTRASSTRAATSTSSSSTPRRRPRTSSSRSRSRTAARRRRRIDLLPTVWFRNTWSWRPNRKRPPRGRRGRARTGASSSTLEEDYLGRRYLHVAPDAELLFTENETNAERLFGAPNAVALRQGRLPRVRHPRQHAPPSTRPERGTKAAARHAPRRSPPAASARMRLRLTDVAPGRRRPARRGVRPHADAAPRRGRRVLRRRRFPTRLSDDEKNVMRQAFAGMLWSKQFYKYDVRRWLDGDPLQPPPPAAAQDAAATATGATSSTPTSSRCPTPGSSRGTRPGTSRSTASSSRSWTRSSPRTSSS